MIEDDGGFMRRETAADYCGYDPFEVCCMECGSTEDCCPCETFVPDREVEERDLDEGWE